MININDKTHDRILSLISQLELDVHEIHQSQEGDYVEWEAKLQRAIARVHGAHKVFDIINGNV